MTNRTLPHPNATLGRRAHCKKKASLSSIGLCVYRRRPGNISIDLVDHFVSAQCSAGWVTKLKTSNNNINKVISLLTCNRLNKEQNCWKVDTQMLLHSPFKMIVLFLSDHVSYTNLVGKYTWIYTRNSQSHASQNFCH